MIFSHWRHLCRQGLVENTIVHVMHYLHEATAMCFADRWRTGKPLPWEGCTTSAGPTLPVPGTSLYPQKQPQYISQTDAGQVSSSVIDFTWATWLGLGLHKNLSPYLECLDESEICGRECSICRKMRPSFSGYTSAQET